MNRCYYRVLGLTHRASQDEIKKAFRLLALKWHPDRNPRDPEAGVQFRYLFEAYEALVDPVTRGRYDRVMGYVKIRGKVHRDVQDGRDDSGASLEQVLEECFGIRLQERRGGMFYDLRFDLQVTRSCLKKGHSEDIHYVRRVFCGECSAGRGHRRTSGCAACNGEGEVEELCTVKVWIPPDSEDGERLRFPGAGDVFREAGRRGDLVVVLHVVDH